MFLKVDIYIYEVYVLIGPIQSAQYMSRAGYAVAVKEKRLLHHYLYNCRQKHACQLSGTCFKTSKKSTKSTVRPAKFKQLNGPLDLASFLSCVPD